MLNTQLPEQSGAAQAYLLGSFQKLAAFPSLAETSLFVLGQKTFPGRVLRATP